MASVRQSVAFLVRWCSLVFAVNHFDKKWLTERPTA